MGFKSTTLHNGACLAIMGWLAIQPVQAADLPVRSAPVLPIFAAEPDWSGFYFGRHLGGFVSGRGKKSFASGDGGPVAVNGLGGVGGRTGNAVGRISGPGIFSGFHGGYNLQQGHAVFGLEGALDGLGRSSDLLGSLRGRIGYAAGSILVYGTAGVAVRSLGGGRLGTFIGGNGGSGGNGGPKGDGGTGGNGFGTLPVSRNSATRAGFVGGLGAEVKLTAQVSAGIEALYYRFGKNPGFGVSRDAFAINGRLTFHPGSPAAQAVGEYASWGVSMRAAMSGRPIICRKRRSTRWRSPMARMAAWERAALTAAAVAAARWLLPACSAMPQFWGACMAVTTGNPASSSKASKAMAI